MSKTPKPSEELKSYVNAYLMARVLAEAKRDDVNAVYKEVLTELPIFADAYDCEDGHQIFDPDHMYLSKDNERAKEIYASADKLLKERGIKPADMDKDFCPALVAESLQMDVKHLLIKAMARMIVKDRTPEDLLFQVLVDWGVDLALPITTEAVAGKTVFFVDGSALAACFDPDISEDLVKELAKRKPLRAVFGDSSYGTDSVKINVEQLFKLLSPSTQIKSL